jgi:hypothetical protein
MQMAAVPRRGALTVVGAGRAFERRARVSLAATATHAIQQVIDAILDRLLTDETVDRIMQSVEAAGLAQLVADRMLADGIAEQIAQRAIAGPELARVVASVIQSELLDETIARLLEAPALWVLVDEVARSPSVTEAIAHQGTGFVEEVAGKARDRSRDADAWVQRAARRFSRRRTADAFSDRGEVSRPGPVSSGPST